MRRLSSALFCASLCTLSASAPADGSGDGRGSALPEVQWALHVVYLPGNQDARFSVSAAEGVIAVRAPWQCIYKRTIQDQHDIVKIKCLHETGAVVGTVAMCKREVGQADLAQLSIGVDGQAAYEMIDLSCYVPRDRGRGDESYDQRK